MSEVDIDFHVEFKDEKTADIFKTLLSSYDHDLSGKDDYRTQLEILKSAGINGDRLFNSNTSDCEFSAIESMGDSVLRFHLFGGVLGGTIFYEQLLNILLETSPIEVYTLAFNNQVGEIAVFAYKDGDETHYYTGDDGDSDDRLFDILDQENALDQLIQMHTEGRLTMPEREAQRVNGVDVSILENEELYDAQILRFLKRGVVFGFAVFLAGWLILDYFWTSLIGGLISACIVTFAGAYKLQDAKDAYDQEIDQLIREDAEETGISEDQALALMQYLEKSMTQVEEGAK